MADIGNAAAQSLSTWTDLSGFSALRHQAETDQSATLPAVAKQFESMFTQMLLKSMRDASFGDPLFESQATDEWQDMYDQQLSLNLSQHGKGLGIADMLVRQLGGHNSGEHGDKQAGAVNGAGLVDTWKQRLYEVEDATRSAGRAAMSWLPADAEAFVRELAPQASIVAKELGLSLRTVLAQAALETQWGKHMPTQTNGSSSFNLFGIKAGSSWGGPRVTVPTVEYEDGIAVRKQAQFRAYRSTADSLADYADLIGKDPRYAEARGRGDDVLGYARALIEGGYATDPEYAGKVAAIANSAMMRDALDALKKTTSLPTP
ncbi:flagellar assembly peptidoglycan hydrolase FlgJ [Dyella caseinilytica]|uniref:Peptidoglycan hydrolase FlgJ n=1 Tax=Dyella caseinilytica TaxID=1849581 RepID=A0ABX7GU71_9GAMM|nr:flagellar assembly peptidoglycan hydrolase FlgJ [Dyella caseinilytica]QRN53424.1 flagellar assembly peptidoglycan hydrolase FlgJ [Dyella caseinilytica]GFZ86476.1 flagellar rod assembly protein/muramidase FlgJ [Dyella caseinilytica]